MDSHDVGADEVEVWPLTDQLPSYSIYDRPAKVSIRFAGDWSIHLPATADSSAYLRRLAAVVATCADVVEEVAARSCVPVLDPMRSPARRTGPKR